MVFVPVNCVSTQIYVYTNSILFSYNTFLQKHGEHQSILEIQYEKLKTENDQLKQTLKVLSMISLSLIH